jgi:GNAT superfamily N-acetyltransferase
MAVTIRRVFECSEPPIAGLCQLLQDSVHGGASVGFMAPLADAEAEAYWRKIFGQLGPELWLWVAEDGDHVVGSVQLAPCVKPNGRHRAELQKLFVHSAHRGSGIARRLLEAAEEAARASGLTLLVLDTLQGSAAETIYPRLGWSRVGAVPDYAQSPFGGLHPTVFFYKRLPPG